jgi:hypothetical protein
MLAEGYRLVRSGVGGEVRDGAGSDDGSAGDAGAEGGGDGGAKQKRHSSAENSCTGSKAMNARRGQAKAGDRHGETGNEREAWSLEEERSWESFFVGLLGVWPHFHVCGARRWWNVTCRGSSGECSICREALSSQVTLSSLPLVRVRQPLHGDSGIGAGENERGSEDEVNGEGGQQKWVAPVILECLHLFHASCVEEWFRRRERSGVKCVSVRM